MGWNWLKTIFDSYLIFFVVEIFLQKYTMPSQSLLAVAKAEEKAFMDVKRHKMVNGVFSWNLSLDIDNI